MSTRSLIGIKTGNQYTYIYCHYDGYPSNNGKILLEHYNNTNKIMELLALGDISTLAPSIGVKRDFDLYLKLNKIKDLLPEKQRSIITEIENIDNSMVKAYHRDREEPLKLAITVTDIEKAINDAWAEYAYAFDTDKQKWYYRTLENKTWELLTKKIVNE